MDLDAIRARKREIEARFGPWTFHNYRLADGIYTIGPDRPEPLKQRRIFQIVADLAGDVRGKRVLDLGSGEGLYAVEMARAGARVVAVEGREGNCEKIRLAKDVFGLENLELVRGDVRAFPEEPYDFILCLGILYHLPAADVFALVERMFASVRHFALIDTHYASRPTERHEHRGWTYWGWPFREYTEDSKAALDNLWSTWFTRESLVSLLARTGFSSVMECHLPPGAPVADRCALVAFRGTRVEHGTDVPLPRETLPPRDESIRGLLRRFLKRLV